MRDIQNCQVRSCARAYARTCIFFCLFFCSSLHVKCVADDCAYSIYRYLRVVNKKEILFLISQVRKELPLDSHVDRFLAAHTPHLSGKDYDAKDLAHAFMEDIWPGDTASPEAKRFSNLFWTAALSNVADGPSFLGINQFTMYRAPEPMHNKEDGVPLNTAASLARYRSASSPTTTDNNSSSNTQKKTTKTKQKKRSHVSDVVMTRPVGLEQSRNWSKLAINSLWMTWLDPIPGATTRVPLVVRIVGWSITAESHEVYTMPVSWVRFDGGSSPSQSAPVSPNANMSQFIELSPR